MKDKNVSFDTYCKYFFISVITIFISLFGLRMILSEQIDISYANNRAAYKVPKFSFMNFLNGNFQEELELAIGDQFLGSEQFATLGISSERFLYESVQPFIIKNGYKLVAEDLYIYNNGKHLLFEPRNDYYINGIYDDTYSQFVKNANFYNTIELKEKYLYLIHNDRSVNFDNIDDAYLNKVLALYPDYKADYLKVDSYDVYEKYFYRNDHHWNHVGSYQGYVDIAKLLLGEDEKTLKPVDEITVPFKLSGTKSNSSQLFEYEDYFKAYIFDIPKYDLYVNGELTSNDIRNDLINHPEYYPKDFKFDYTQWYGYNKAEVIYDFHAPEKENLLIIGISDKASISENIATHFNKTYCLFTYMNKDININEYIKKNKIDKVLIIGAVDAMGWDQFLLNAEVK